MKNIMLNAYLILTTTLFAVAFCGSYHAPYTQSTNIIRAILLLLGAWSGALLFATQP